MSRNTSPFSSATPIVEGVPEVLTNLLKTVMKFERRVRAEASADNVHDMRVATKRFRESLRLYGAVFRPAPFRRHREQIERLNDVLG